ncbi:hypothetical protein GCM10023176_44370 [Micromonospora coerulea]|uniref:Uncharacterized protein n=1 Tax=Micromonospora coerulea TaxID=47856 RepID=A0ABP8SVJ4_9ACTN
MTGAQRGRHPADRGGQLARAGPVHEDRAGRGGELTHQRPAADLTLGHQPGRRHGEHREHVQPGDVVGDHQGPPARQPAPDHQPDTQGAQRPLGPAADRRVPPAGGQHRQQPGQTRTEQEHAEYAGQPAGPPQRRHRRLHRDRQAARAAAGSGPPEAVGGRHRCPPRKCRR